MMWRFLIFLLIFCKTGSSAAGGAVFDLNTFYLTDTLSTDDTDEHAITIYAFFLGFMLDNKKRFQLGWNYASYTTNNSSAGTETEYTSPQMGPAFVMFIDKDRNWRFSFAYNLVTTAEYTSGSTSEEWRGSGMAGDLGYQFQATEIFSFGLRLNYSTTAFSESLVGTTQSSVSHSKALIYPSIALTVEL